MQNLIAEYKKSLKLIRKGAAEVEREMNRIDIDTAEYMALQERKSFLNSFISNLEYSIEWMQTTRRPGSRRGIENLAAYQREKPTDNIDRARRIDLRQPKVIEVAPEDVIMIDSVLSILSPQEKEAYIYIKANVLSYEETARMMGCTRATIQSYVRRAEEKIEAQKSEVQMVLM